jgi:hypothetical protein
MLCTEEMRHLSLPAKIWSIHASRNQKPACRLHGLITRLNRGE